MARNIRLSAAGGSTCDTGSFTSLTTTDFCATNICSENQYDTSGCKIKNWVEIACCVCWTGSTCSAETYFCLPFNEFSEVCFYISMPGCASTTVCAANRFAFLQCANGVINSVPYYFYFNSCQRVCCCCYITACVSSCKNNTWHGRFWQTGGCGLAFHILDGNLQSGGYAGINWGHGNSNYGGACDLTWETLCGVYVCNAYYAGSIYPSFTGLDATSLKYVFYGVPL